VAAQAAVAVHLLQTQQAAQPHLLDRVMQVVQVEVMPLYLLGAAAAVALVRQVQHQQRQEMAEMVALPQLLEHLLLAAAVAELVRM
jgi:hypothetical protein